MRRLLLLTGFALILILNSCSPQDGIERTRTRVPRYKQIPVVIGETFSDNTSFPVGPAIAGTWRLENFRISSKGSLKGKLSISLDQPVKLLPNHQDVLTIQLVANYIWIPMGDIRHVTVGEILPIKASLSDDTSVTFSIDREIEIPQQILDMDPLDQVEISMAWFRVNVITENTWGGYRATLGTAEIRGDQDWRGTPLFDRTVSLNGAVKMYGGLWQVDTAMSHANLPTSVPTITPIPTQPYPVPLPDPEGLYP